MERPSLCPSSCWIPDKARQKCHCCLKSFHSLYRRKHHCRVCGEIVCRVCSSFKLSLHDYGTKVRICTKCTTQATVLKQQTAEHENVPEKPKECPSVIVQPVEKPKQVPIASSKAKSNVPVLILIALKLILLTALAVTASSMQTLCITGGIAILLVVLTGIVVVTDEPPCAVEPEKESSHLDTMVKKEDTVPTASMPTSDSNASIAASELLHCYSLVLEELIDEKTNADDLGWKLYGKKNNVEIHLKTYKHPDEYELTFVQGKTTTDIPIPALLDTIKEHSLEYDGNMKQVDELEVHDKEYLKQEMQQQTNLAIDEIIRFVTIHTRYHRIFPTTARDACLAHTLVTYEENNKKRAMMLARSMEHDLAPPLDNHVRLHVRGHILILEEIDKVTTQIRTVSMVDPMGAVPSFVVAKTAPERALLLHRLIECAKKHYL